MVFFGLPGAWYAIKGGQMRREMEEMTERFAEVDPFETELRNLGADDDFTWRSTKANGADPAAATEALWLGFPDPAFVPITHGDAMEVLARALSSDGPVRIDSKTIAHVFDRMLLECETSINEARLYEIKDECITEGLLILGPRRAGMAVLPEPH
jgi:hypothetical protein